MQSFVLFGRFCSMNLLIYIDRGLISSSSVNGRTVKDGGAASGIMVRIRHAASWPECSLRLLAAAAAPVARAQLLKQTCMYSLQGDFDLTLFQDGLLPSAFLVGVTCLGSAAAS